MGSVGDCYDNAMCESFFATLECELLDRRKFATKAEARVACFEFIEGSYNPSRRHSAGISKPLTVHQTGGTPDQHSGRLVTFSKRPGRTLEPNWPAGAHLRSQGRSG